MQEVQHGPQMVNGSTFDGSEPGGSAIYIVRPDGGELKRLADGVVPRWSRDGKWIYYSRSRPQQLYRVARTGGDPEEISGTAEGWVRRRITG